MTVREKLEINRGTCILITFIPGMFTLPGWEHLSHDGTFDSAQAFILFYTPLTISILGLVATILLSAIIYGYDLGERATEKDMMIKEF